MVSVTLPLVLVLGGEAGGGVLSLSLHLFILAGFCVLLEGEKSESLESTSGSHCISESELLRDSSSL